MKLKKIVKKRDFGLWAAFVAIGVGVTAFLVWYSYGGGEDGGPPALSHTADKNQVSAQIEDIQRDIASENTHTLTQDEIDAQVSDILRDIENGN